MRSVFCTPTFRGLASESRSDSQIQSRLRAREPAVVTGADGLAAYTVLAPERVPDVMPGSLKSHAFGYDTQIHSPPIEILHRPVVGQSEGVLHPPQEAVAVSEEGGILRWEDADLGERRDGG